MGHGAAWVFWQFWQVGKQSKRSWWSCITIYDLTLEFTHTHPPHTQTQSLPLWGLNQRRTTQKCESQEVRIIGDHQGGSLPTLAIYVFLQSRLSRALRWSLIGKWERKLKSAQSKRHLYVLPEQVTQDKKTTRGEYKSNHRKSWKRRLRIVEITNTIVHDVLRLV